MVWVAPSMFLETNMAVVTSREKTKIQDITKSKNQNLVRQRAYVDQNLSLQSVRIISSINQFGLTTTTWLLYISNSTNPLLTLPSLIGAPFSEEHSY